MFTLETHTLKECDPTSRNWSFLGMTAMTLFAGLLSVWIVSYTKITRCSEKARSLSGGSLLMMLEDNICSSRALDIKYFSVVDFLTKVSDSDQTLIIRGYKTSRNSAIIFRSQRIPDFSLVCIFLLHLLPFPSCLPSTCPSFPAERSLL